MSDGGAAEPVENSNPASTAPDNQRGARERARRSSIWSQLWSFLDLRFERYLTRAIVRFTWVFVLCVGAVTAILILYVAIRETVGFVQPEAQTGGYTFAPDEFFRVIGAILSHPLGRAAAKFVLLGFALLYLRVLCELLIVLFNIAWKLGSIESLARQRLLDEQIEQAERG